MARYAPKITEWPLQERPRERLLEFGAESLSDAELLAIILRTGSGEETCIDLARQMLGLYGDLRGLDQQSAETLCQIKGIGTAKAAQIKAALELARRLIRSKGRVRDRVTCSEDVHRLFQLRLRDLGREEFYTLFLSACNDIIDDKSLFQGSLSQSVVSPREIILYAVQCRAASVILMHNHPSGNPNPSREDKEVTAKIVQACRYVDITVLDHIIIGRDSYFSFADHGLIGS